MDTVIVLFIAEIGKKEDVLERIRLSNTPEHCSLQSSVTTTRSNHNTFLSPPLLLYLLNKRDSILSL